MEDLFLVFFFMGVWNDDSLSVSRLFFADDTLIFVGLNRIIFNI
jgi:hypothetical protein